MKKSKILSMFLLACFLPSTVPHHVTFAYDYNNTCFSNYFSNFSPPEKQSLTCHEARVWYNTAINKISEMVANCTDEKTLDVDAAHFAFDMRALFKKASRDAMSCVKCAKYLDATESNPTFDNLFIKYNNSSQKLIQKACSTRASVNLGSKIADFFEKHTPRLFENVLFPSFMTFSRILKFHPTLFVFAIVLSCAIAALAKCKSDLPKRISATVSKNIRWIKDFFSRLKDNATLSQGKSLDLIGDNFIESSSLRT